MKGKKMTGRLRDRLFPEGSWIRVKLRIINRIVKTLFNVNYMKKQFINIKQQGFKKTIKEIKSDLKSGVELSKGEFYQIWIKNNEPNENKLNEQRNKKFDFEPKISVIVPMYNTPINFFQELVECLINQTYKNWELCLADGSPEKNTEIESIISKDNRIKYVFLGENKGIAGNSNEALKLATGDFIALLDHDDLLPEFSLFEIVKCINKNPNVEFIYTDEDKIEEKGGKRYDPYFKSDFAPDTLRANNYICHFSVYKKELMNKLKGFKEGYDGAQDYDLILRMSENTNNIIHIPRILYHWRVHSLSTAQHGGAAKPYAYEAGIKAIQSHIDRLNLRGKVESGVTLGTYKINYDIIGNPKVSILIPNKDYIETLKVCLDSIKRLTTYNNYEIIIIENNSEDKKTFDFYKEIEGKDNIKVVYYPEKEFNYSKIINFGVKKAKGEYIVQLNNDTELITKNWLKEMLMYAQREDVGAVGVKLFYPDKTIQHAGIIVGIGGVAGHVFKNLPESAHGYFSKESMIQNMSAVTAACIMTRKSIYDEVGYMDEKFKVAFNDVDFCLKIREKGKLIVYNPYVQFIHYESKSRGYEDTPEKIERFKAEIDRFKRKWNNILENGDPYYNINLRLDNDQCDIKMERVKLKGE
ncbi:MAG: glycosyltransferase [Clostridia bacterium]|nr:glycosyltransferase [Clostridia bacterium]